MRSQDITKLRQNLDTCLRGEAIKWWNNEIDPIMQTGLIHSLNIEDWCKQIKKRFRMPPIQAMERLANTKYTLLDVNCRKSPSSYVSTIVALAKQAGKAEAEYQLVLRAWRNMDIALRSDIDEPQEGTTTAQFIEKLNANKLTGLTNSKRRAQGLRYFGSGSVCAFFSSTVITGKDVTIGVLGADGRKHTKIAHVMIFWTMLTWCRMPCVSS